MTVESLVRTAASRAVWARPAVAAAAFLASLLAGAVGPVSRAHAEPIDDVDTLQDLIDLNAGNPGDGIVAGGVVLSGIRYYDFSYLSAGDGSPASNQVSVETSPSSASGATGFRFLFDWLAIGGSDVSSTIQYKVHAESSSRTITSAEAAFDGDLPGNTVEAGTSARSSMAVARPSPGGSVGQVELYTDGNPDAGPSGPAPDVYMGSLLVSPGGRDLTVSTLIAVESGATGIATIGRVDNAFGTSDIPEPAALSFAAVLGLLVRRGPRRHGR